MECAIIISRRVFIWLIFLQLYEHPNPWNLIFFIPPNANHHPRRSSAISLSIIFIPSVASKVRHRGLENPVGVNVALFTPNGHPSNSKFTLSPESRSSHYLVQCTMVLFFVQFHTPFLKRVRTLPGPSMHAKFSFWR